MLAKRGWLASFAIAWIFVLLISATISHAQVSYTTTWVANTYSTTPTYVGNAMRSMWVAPEGVAYTASLWDESQGSINIYQNGQKIGTIGAHGETQGGAITGDSTYLFAPLQFNTTLGGNGFIARYNRSTKTRDLTWSASSDTTERRADVITGITDTGTLVYVSDHPDNLVRCYTIAGVWQSDWSLIDPGAIAVDGSGNIWVAQMNEGTIQEFSPSGSVLSTINMGSSSRPSALYYDAANNQLMIGDQGPNMNIQIYGNLSSTPSLVGTFGVQGGYLDTTTGNKGQTGSLRFTRIVGIGKDTSGNLYVLNNPWGGTWDLGRNGKTDLHVYNSSGVLQYTLQGLNFEGNAAFDPGTDGAYLYSGQDVYSGLGGGGYVGNSVDALDYPTDPRVDATSASRGFDFGLMASVNGHRILATAGQNSDAFLFSYFPTNQYVSIPFGSLPGQASAAGYNYTNYFNTTARIRNGFCLDTNGDIWVGLDKTNAITHYPLTGFDANGLPIYGTPTTTPTPSTIAPLGGIEYIPSTDTMVLMNANGTDWTSLGGRVEVYHGWKAGHTTNPDLVINLKTSQNPKGRAAAGDYLFISYVHTVPDIDAYNLTTGADDLTMTSADPNVAVGNDVDSMYGIRAYQTSTGDYLISKDNYNNNSIVIHRMTVVPTPNFSISATPSSQTVTQGSSTTYTATIGALNGFTDTVNLSVTGLPAGATASFNPASITTSGSSTLTVSTASTTPAGTYTLTITGATSTLSRTATVTLVVPGPPDFSTSASPNSQTVMQGNSTIYTASISPLSGFTGTVNLSVSGLPAGATAGFNPMSVSGSGHSTLTVSTATTTPTGTYTLTITGTDSTTSHSANVTLVVARPDFSISATPSSQTAVPGNSTTYTTTIGPLNGFTDTVNLTVNGLPTSATASFSPASVSASGSSTLTVSTATTTPTGTYTLTITGTDGSLSHSATVTLVVNTNAGGLPPGWTDLDVGSVSVAGSASYSNGTFTVNGAGTSISGAADQFNYVYQAAAGTNSTITARVVSIANTNSGAQAGVMIRETLDPGSTMADINVTPSNGVTWVYRSTTGGGSRTPGLVAPYWVRVARSGSTFTGYYSSDGVTWTQQGTVTISMASNVYIGLVVSSRVGSELATAIFDNVSITTPKQSLTINPQAATAPYGSATATLTATANFTGSTSPSGSLVFQVGNGNQVPGTCSVSGNTFTCTANYPMSSIAAGSNTINVTYPGDSTFASGSAQSNLTVTQATPTVTATSNTCIYNASGCAGSGSAIGANGEVLTPVTLSYTGTGNVPYGPAATPPIVVGTYAVKASFAGNSNYTAATSTLAPIVISPASTTFVGFSISPNPQQYSDLISISATPVSVPSIGGSVSFYINYGTPTQQQVGATQIVGPGGTASVTSMALLESVPGAFIPGPHNVTAIFTPDDSVDFTGNASTVPLTIAMEDANLTYTGQYLVYTSSPSTYSVTAPLTFTVQDSNAVPPTSTIYDQNPGDIRNARYKILVNGIASAECSNLQPSLVTTDTRIGTIGCNYTFSFSSGQTGATPTITVVPETNSYYAATSGDSGLTMSVNLPNQTSFITGGGYLVNATSAGTYAGDPGMNTNFGFNSKYNKDGTSLQGNANIIVRSHGRVYQVKSNSISSLGITDTAQGGYGSFIANADIQDVTDPQNPISIEGNDSLTISLHDNATPGTNDTIAISLYNGGTLRFSSNWSGTNTVEQNLGGGDLAAH